MKNVVHCADHYLLRFGVALSHGATAQPALVFEETSNAWYLANLNGDGLGNIRLRGGGYAQVLFSQPIK